MRPHLRPVGIVAAAALVLMSAACAVPTAGTVETPAAGVNAPTASAPATSSAEDKTAASTPASEPPAGDASAASNQAAFGETYRWADGLEVTVSTPTPFTPGKYASAEPATAYLSYTVTIVNNTGDVYEPAVFFTSVQSGDQEADQVFDSENNLTGSPSTAILAGRQSTFTIGFGVSNPDDVVMEVTPGFEYKGAFFTH
jgi:hypothetical protein